MPSRPLRLGFNGRTFSSDRVRGFTRHTLSLLNALTELPERKEIHLFSDQGIARSHAETLSRFKVHRSRVRPHLAWEHASLPFEMAMSRIEIFHSTTNIGVPLFPLSGVKRVVTVHDLITLNEMKRTLPASWVAFKARAAHEVSWQATLLADAIITVSRFSATQIEQRFPALQGKIHVIPNGVDERFTPGEAVPDLLARYGLAHRGFFLYVGGFEERKNVGMLIRAYRTAFESDPKAPLLVLVGDFSKASERLLSLGHEHAGVRWLGYVPDDELIGLYRAARCAVVPSREEGFGFQVLEAMASGTPVLSSNSTSLPEVGADAAEYFFPGNPEALKVLLIRAVSDDLWLQALSEKGRLRARQFTWRRAARSTLEVYQGLTPRINS